MRGIHLAKSVEDHKKNGTYKPSRHANRAETLVKPLETLPNPPAHFTGRHSEKWSEVCQNIKDIGILGKNDLDLIEVYVSNWFIWVDATAEVASTGITFVDENGKVTKNPAFAIMQESGKVVTQIGALIGYSPRARMGIKVNTGDTAKKKSILDVMKGGSLAKATKTG